MKNSAVYLQKIAASEIARRIRACPREIALGLFFGLFFALLFSLGALRTMENSIYDLRFTIKPKIDQAPNISVLEIDDESLKYIGRWPWRRSVYVEALDAMKLLGAHRVIFDIEFTEASSLALSQQDMIEFPLYVRNELEALEAGIARLRGLAYAGGAGMGAILADFEANIRERRENIINRISQVGQNDDQAFARGIAENGQVVLSIRCYSISNATTGGHQYVRDTYGMRVQNGAEGIRGVIHDKWLDIPAEPLFRGPRRLAFTNVDTDRDGVRRRIALFREWNGRLFPQLAFAGLLESALSGGGDGIAATNIEFYPGSHALLRNVLFPGGDTARDIRIPLDTRGQMLINWAGTWRESFSRFSFADLFEYIKTAEALRDIFSRVDREYFAEQGGLVPLVGQYTRLADARRSGVHAGESDLEEMRALDAQIHAVGAAELEAMRESLLSMQTDLAGAQDKEELLASIHILASTVSNVESARSHYDRLYTKAAEHIRGCYIIIGQTASSTTDLGTIPLDINQPQVFLHANTLNTILQRDFITTPPAIVDILIILALPLLFAQFTLRAKPLRILVFGFAGIVVLAIINQFLFNIGVFMQFVPAALALGASLLVISAMHYVQGDKEKKYIRTAFSHYLSADVIDVLVKDPQALKLGGERKELTAFFSDVQGFSGISESLSPEGIVDLLNEYLTDMTDIIFGEGGTVDKFVGDAIVAFYGAPIYFENHAERACLAALVMQAKLRKMRPVWKEKYGHELYVRMGINTGPMVVGNMGSRTRFDYTMMGDSVNLASRLEGVNKYYKTFILASEFTVREIGDSIARREIDVLRVVGKKEPVKVYELVCPRASADAQTMDLLGCFEEGLELYKKREWAKAGETFRKALALDPGDGPSQVYIDRCAQFSAAPPPDSWDGVYEMKSK